MLLPVGFALSRAALRQIGGLMISVFYLNFFIANVGRIDGWLESMGGTNFWLLRAGVVGAAALVLAIEAWTGRQLVAPTPVVADKMHDVVANDENELTAQLARIFSAPSTVETIQKLMSLAQP